MAAPYKRVHIVVNPASGKDEPILNVINDVCRKYEVEWDVSVTHKYGDATEQAMAAIAAGVDLVAGYGGDGTQHEIACAVLRSARKIPMAILPGGTGNGFCRENNVPNELAPAVELLCTSSKLRQLDAAIVGDQFFVQRLYTGVEPELQTSREDKDKYGVFAYAVTAKQQMLEEATYHLVIDGQAIEARGTKCYVVNSGMSGKGLTFGPDFSATDGMLDVFILKRDLAHIGAVAGRFLHLDRPSAELDYWHCKEVTIASDPERAVWTDGEYSGHTPVTARILPGVLPIVVP